VDSGEITGGDHHSRGAAVTIPMATGEGASIIPTTEII